MKLFKKKMTKEIKITVSKNSETFYITILNVKPTKVIDVISKEINRLNKERFCVELIEII